MEHGVFALTSRHAANKTADMLVYQTDPLGTYINNCFCFSKFTSELATCEGTLCIRFRFMNYTTVFLNNNLHVSPVTAACMYYITSPEAKNFCELNLISPVHYTYRLYI